MIKPLVPLLILVIADGRAITVLVVSFSRVSPPGSASPGADTDQSANRATIEPTSVRHVRTWSSVGPISYW